MDNETLILDISSNESIKKKVLHDFHTCSDVIIEANSTKMISTNVYFKLPSNFDGYIVTDPQLVIGRNHEFDVSMQKLFNKHPLIICLVNKNEFGIKFNKGDEIGSLFIDRGICDATISS
jgi:dUTPase